MGKHSTAEPRRRSSASVRIPPARPALSRPGNNSNKHNEADGQGRSFQSISVLADNSYGASSQVRVFSLSLENSFFSGELLTKFC